ncbi:MAG: IclR family transcriptional regulator [Microbacterium sp.]|uniref:IclR family transcriptional regulator n=1 Tax=Microbacterium sp. TaxID=51671 RepID=UPI001AD53E51|nr:IclR family transcriptional regulator [Microbacterium sp.]MBN9153979.1 IclR family transcriptional regulator [Microbacterium sp.]MBN9175032.1 IclR family transcriptional regulator [Microbacterium sp.]MBN9183515.1 IclR family transcriptional regulator [Microbacterium sp.]MBN9185928.1 IclR family transcriptional regulator [Microbacterium sp.]
MVKHVDSKQGEGLVAVDRAISVIDALRDVGTASLADIARATGLSEPTALRYLAALRKHHIVGRDVKDGSYRLGVKLYEWGQAAPVETDPRSVAERPLMELASLLGETVELASAEGRQLVVLAVYPGSHAIRKEARVGDLEEWHATSVGKAILAQAGDEYVAEVLAGRSLNAFTPNTRTTAAALRVELDRVRERGYAIDDEESEQGLRCVGVAFRGRSGRYEYALSASGPAYRMTPDREGVIADRLLAAAATIEEGLGVQAG